MINLQEDYIFPIHLKQVDTIYGIPIYSSEDIKKKFAELISENLKDIELSKKISELVSQDKLVPCFVMSTMFKMLLSKIGIGRKELGFRGKYIVKKDRAFILVDMAEYKMFRPSNEELIKTTIHELVHMSFQKNWKELVILFMSGFIKFYISFYECYFDVVVEKNEVEVMINRQLKNHFSKGEAHFYIAAGDKIKKEKVDHYMSLVRDYGRSGWNYSLYEKYEDIISCLNSAYEEVYKIPWGDTPYPVQELWNPSEIVCVISEFYKTDPKIKKVILMI